MWVGLEEHFQLIVLQTHLLNNISLYDVIEHK